VDVPGEIALAVKAKESWKSLEMTAGYDVGETKRAGGGMEERTFFFARSPEAPKTG